MSDRVARASFECWRKRMTEKGRFIEKGQAFEDMCESEQEFAHIHALAVIAAMREPTKAMLSVDCPMTMGTEHLYVSEGDLQIVWNKMIDEALK